MTKIQRYEMNHKGLPEPDDNGVWVFRKEHDAIVASLQEQVQKLAAHLHNIALTGTETLCGPDEYTDDREKWYRAGVSEMVSLAKNAGTDAVIREVGAKAVEGFGDVLGLGSLHLSLILKKCAYEHAAKLRVGEQP